MPGCDFVDIAATQTLGASTQGMQVQNPAPADMMRAYAALGLNYPNQQPQRWQGPTRFV